MRHGLDHHAPVSSSFPVPLPLPYSPIFLRARSLTLVSPPRIPSPLASVSSLSPSLHQAIATTFIMDCIRIHPMISPITSTVVPWEPPQSIMFSLSSIRDDPLPKRPKPSALHSCDASVAAPTSTFSSIVKPITGIRSPKHPTYTSSDPQVIDVLNECARSSLEPYPLLSDRPRWVFIVAALSTLYHPSHPAHLAFWRPDIMNETGVIVDKFLKTKEAKYLESRHGWIDAEISLYTLRGYQRGYYPDLYSPNNTTRTLRKRKAGMIASSRSDEPDPGIVDDEIRPKTRTRTTTRSTAARAKPSTENDPGSSLTTTLEEDHSLPISTQSIYTKPRTRKDRLGDQQQPGSVDVPAVSLFKGHRRRSSSMTSSGLSLSNSVTTTDTLINEDMDVQNDDDASVASADTMIGSVLELKKPASISSASMEKLALLVDVAAASAISPLTTPPLTPPPSTRRSKRTVRPPKRRQGMDDEEKEMIIERSKTRPAAGPDPVVETKRKKRTRRF